MKQKKAKKAWYWQKDGMGFDSFLYMTPPTPAPVVWSQTLHGPFDTFEECQNDALEYFKCDKRTIAATLKTIRNYRKPNK